MKEQLQAIRKQLVDCQFQCEGGPLHLNKAFLELARLSEVGVELTPTQIADLTILLGKTLYHARTIKLESVPRLQRSVVQQILKLVTQ